jgi:Tol biopolymer transport system component
MNTLTLSGVARRAIPAAVVAATTIACADMESSTAPARIAAPDASTAVGQPGPGLCTRCTEVGQIAFASNRDGSLEIYIAADSANAVAARITNTRSNEMNPAWSPDYKKLAFVTDRDGNLEIYTMKATGAGVVRLTNHPANDAHPVYSPDGKKIAFTSVRDGNEEIYVMNADGTNVKQLTVDGASDRSPTWSPDGSKIAFVSDRAQTGYPQIWIMNAADGSGAVRFSPATAVERSPHYSPDGKRIAFISLRPNANDLVWREVTKDPTAAVTHTVASDFNWMDRPTWSRDGLQIAVSKLLPSGQTYVAMDAFNGTGVTFVGVTNGYANFSQAWSR